MLRQNLSIKTNESQPSSQNRMKKQLNESEIINKKSTKQFAGLSKILKGQEIGKVKMSRDGHKDLLEDTKELTELLKKNMKIVEHEESQKEDPTEIKLQRIKKILGLKKSSEKSEEFTKSFTHDAQNQRERTNLDKKQFQQFPCSKKAFDCKQIKRRIYKKYGFKQKIDPKVMQIKLVIEAESKADLGYKNEIFLNFTDDIKENTRKLVYDFQMKSKKITEYQQEGKINQGKEGMGQFEKIKYLNKNGEREEKIQIEENYGRQYKEKWVLRENEIQI